MGRRSDSCEDDPCSSEDPVPEELEPDRNLSHSPLFQVAFILQNTPWDNTATLHAIEISPIELDYGVAKELDKWVRSRVEALTPGGEEQ